MTIRRVVVINGSVRTPSRTGELLDAVKDAVGARIGIEAATVALAQEGVPLLSALTRDNLPPAAEALIARIEAADLLIVGSPVYRASYTGVLKHLFDLVHRPALSGRIALVAATGGSAQHGLVIEHQLRPLMGFFNLYVVPTGIYATEADFDSFRLASSVVAERIARAADEAAWLLSRKDAVA